MIERFLSRPLARAALVGGSLASGRLFWLRAALGANALKLHRCTRDGTISIGGVSEQMYGEGFLAAWHEVLGEELGERAPEVLYEAGLRGGRWECKKAIDEGVWVPRFLRSHIGRPDLIERVRSSRLFHALLRETLLLLGRLIVSEGGWGVLEDVDLRSDPIRLVVSNAPEPRRLGHTGRCSCHLNRGALAGYVETIVGQPVVVDETTCVSRGDAVCTFEARLPAPQTKEPARAATASEPVGAPS